MPTDRPPWKPTRLKRMDRSDHTGEAPADWRPPPKPRPMNPPASIMDDACDDIFFSGFKTLKTDL